MVRDRRAHVQQEQRLSVADQVMAGIVELVPGGGVGFLRLDRGVGGVVGMPFGVCPGGTCAWGMDSWSERGCPAFSFELIQSRRGRINGSSFNPGSNSLRSSGVDNQTIAQRIIRA